MERGEGSEEHETQVSDDQIAKDSKRKKKTPLQIEMLERAYSENSHPTEGMRLELSSQLGLTNRKIQMWFCNRRLKDKKGDKVDFCFSSVKRKEEKNSFLKEPLTFYEYPEAVLASEVQDDTLFRRNACEKVALGHEEHNPKHERHIYYEHLKALPQENIQQTISDVDPRAAARSILSSWGETFREDGPTLGFEFDPLPPGAFGTPIEPARDGSSVASMEYQNDSVFIRQGNNSFKCVGPTMIGSGPEPTFGNVRRDKQLALLAWEQEVRSRFKMYSKVREGREPSEHQYQLDHAHAHSGEKPFTAVPASRSPNTLGSCFIGACMKQDSYGFESCFKAKPEPILIHPENRKSSSNESIVSFIKQLQGSGYVIPAKTYYGNSSYGSFESKGFESDLQNFEGTDGEINGMEAIRHIHEQVSKKQKLSLKNGHSILCGYAKWNPNATDEWMGLIKTYDEV